jgi:hypothetical protein
MRTSKERHSAKADLVRDLRLIAAVLQASMIKRQVRVL